MVLTILDYGVFGGYGNKVTVDGVKSGFVTIGGKTTSFKDGAFTIGERPDGVYPVLIVTEKGKKVECDPISFVGGIVRPTTDPSLFAAHKQIKALREEIAALRNDFAAIKEKYGEISLF